MWRFLFAQIGSAGGEELVVGRRENLSLLFQDYYSAVTSHFTHSGDRELAGRRAAQGLCGEQGRKRKKKLFLFLNQENPGVGDKRCVEAATCKRQFNFDFSGFRLLPTQWTCSVTWSPLSSCDQVQVLITDENDCVPEFLQSIYSVDGVPETVTTATSLLQGETRPH